MSRLAPVLADLQGIASLPSPTGLPLAGSTESISTNWIEVFQRTISRLSGRFADATLDTNPLADSLASELFGENPLLSALPLEATDEATSTKDFLRAPRSPAPTGASPLIQSRTDLLAGLTSDLDGGANPLPGADEAAQVGSPRDAAPARRSIAADLHWLALLEQSRLERDASSELAIPKKIEVITRPTVDDAAVFGAIPNSVLALIGGAPPVPGTSSTSAVVPARFDGTLPSATVESIPLPTSELVRAEPSLLDDRSPVPILRTEVKVPSTLALEPAAGFAQIAQSTKDVEASSSDQNAATLARVDRAEFVQRVAEALKRASVQSPKVIELDLHPPELGKLRIQVANHEGHLTARIETQSSAARAALVEQIPILERNLGQHGVQIHRLQVDEMPMADAWTSFGGDSTGNDGAARRHAARRGAKSASDEEPDRMSLSMEDVLRLASGMDRIV